MMDDKGRIVGSPLTATAHELMMEARNYGRWYPSVMWGGWGAFLKCRHRIERHGLEELAERFLRFKKYTEHDRLSHRKSAAALMDAIYRRANYGGHYQCHLSPVGDHWWPTEAPDPSASHYDEATATHSWSAWVDGVHTPMTALEYATRYLSVSAQRIVARRIKDGERYKKMRAEYAAREARETAERLRMEFLKMQFRQKRAA